MPRKYTRPKPRLRSRETAIAITKSQRQTLIKAVAKYQPTLDALACMELLAMQVLYDAREGIDRWTETRAALDIFQSKADALSRALQKYEEGYAADVDLAYLERLKAILGSKAMPKPFPSLVRNVVKDLEDLKQAIDDAKSNHKFEPVKNHPATLLREIFECFGIPFNRGKKSPAFDGLMAILKMAKSKVADVAVDGQIRAATKNPQYKISGMYVAAMRIKLCESLMIKPGLHVQLRADKGVEKHLPTKPQSHIDV